MDELVEKFWDISIHSLRMEGDITFMFSVAIAKYFNPLPPHGGRRHNPTMIPAHSNFNPLPPHGGRLFAKPASDFNVAFQSTPSAWRETRCSRNIVT